MSATDAVLLAVFLAVDAVILIALLVWVAGMKKL